MSDIEKMISDTMNELGSAGKSMGRTSGETMKYTLKYFMEFRHINKKELKKRLISLILLIGSAAAIWFFAPNIAAFLVEKTKDFELLQKPFLNKIMSSPVLYKVIGAVLIPYAYLMAIGTKKMEEAKQFTEQFELLGMTKQLNKTIIDEYGNKNRIIVTPELMGRHMPSKDITVRLFKSNGQPLQVWENKRAELESAFNEPIYRLENSGKSLNVIKMVTVSAAYKEELDQKYLKEMEYDQVFEKIGLVGKGTREVNHFGVKKSIKNFPQYLDTKVEEINAKSVEILKFRSTGTELANWQAGKFLMENVLNKLVVRVEQDKKDKQIYRVSTLDLKDDLAEVYEWSDQFIDDEDGVLVLGEGLLGRVTLDLNKLPHVLIGGVTGFGKSVLSNCLTWQLIKKGAVVIPLDFKGGIELDMFSPFHEVVFERKRAIEVLQGVIEEYGERLKLIKSRKLKNITQFNKKYPQEALCRMIVVGDEIAEMLSGASTKEEANQIFALDNQVSTIARLARAVGIHLLLGTQRPDANVLQGQIKNNLPSRICGRMIDKEPSMMILGTPDATRIPDIKGRFMMSLGADIEVFQSYYFKESDIKAGDYVIGQCLVYEGHLTGETKRSKPATKAKRRISIDADESEEELENTQVEKSIKKELVSKVRQDDFDPTEEAAISDAWLEAQIGQNEEDEDEAYVEEEVEYVDEEPEIVTKEPKTAPKYPENVSEEEILVDDDKCSDGSDCDLDDPEGGGREINNRNRVEMI